MDLATNRIKLSGLEVKSQDNPLGDIEIKFTGFRPGEKLFEELLIGDDVMGTDHEKIREILLSTPTGFNPTDGIGDLVWKANQ